MRDANFSKRLSEYLSMVSSKGKLDFVPKGVTSFSISDVRRLSRRAIGNDVYSFLLTYDDMGSQKRKYLVFKAYNKSLDPILRRNSVFEKRDRCIKEFQILTCLERFGFPVPKAYYCESNSDFFDSPFILMEKVESSQHSSVDIDEFARNLARLHSFDITELGIGTLKVPESESEYAKKCILQLKLYLNLYPRFRKHQRKSFDPTIRWLDSNVQSNSCTKYCLLHGDYRALFNSVITKDSKIVIMDWEDAEIGDPAFDVAMAYTRIRVDSGEEVARTFVQKYVGYSNANFSERLFFYRVISQMRLAISHGLVLSNPVRAFEILGFKAFLSFPFSNLPFVARLTGVNLDMVWVESFEKFLKENWDKFFYC